MERGIFLIFWMLFDSFSLVFLFFLFYIFFGEEGERKRGEEGGGQRDAAVSVGRDTKVFEFVKLILRP